MNTKIITLFATAVLVIGATSFLIIATTTTTAQAVPDNKDFCLVAQNPDETVDDCANTKQTCKTVQESYESRGYIILQKCHPTVTGE